MLHERVHTLDDEGLSLRYGNRLTTPPPLVDDRHEAVPRHPLPAGAAFGLRAVATPLSHVPTPTGENIA